MLSTLALVVRISGVRFEILRREWASSRALIKRGLALSFTTLLDLKFFDFLQEHRSFRTNTTSIISRQYPTYILETSGEGYLSITDLSP